MSRVYAFAHVKPPGPPVWWSQATKKQKEDSKFKITLTLEEEEHDGYCSAPDDMYSETKTTVVYLHDGDWDFSVKTWWIKNQYHCEQFCKIGTTYVVDTIDKL